MARGKNTKKNKTARLSKRTEGGNSPTSIKKRERNACRGTELLFGGLKKNEAKGGLLWGLKWARKTEERRQLGTKL